MASLKNLPACRPHSEDVVSGRKKTLSAIKKSFLHSSHMHRIPQSVTTISTSSITTATSLTSEKEHEIITTDLKSSSSRINPLTKAAAEGKIARAVPFEVRGGKDYNQLLKHNMKNNSFKNSGCNSPQKESCKTFVLKNDLGDRQGDEKRVSFNEIKNINDCYNLARTNMKNSERSILKPISKSLDCTVTSDHKITLHSTNSLPEENSNSTAQLNKNVITSVEFPCARVYGVTELCDIESSSGTIFRKVTVRKRRQDMKKSVAIDDGKLNNIEFGVFSLRYSPGIGYFCMEITPKSIFFKGT